MTKKSNCAFSPRNYVSPYKFHAIYVFTILIASCLMLSGCDKKNPSTPQGGTRTTVAIEDYYESPIMITETGYYYNADSENGGLWLHYLDKATGKDILLCAKPECKHDGNEFCVATNKKYSPLAFQLYDGAIYMAAICDGESSYDFKLVRISLDGTSMSEVTTYFSTNLIANNHPSKYRDKDFMMIHRGKALFQICVGGNDEVDDTLYYGTVLFDLNSGELTNLNPEGLSTDFPSWQNPSARGDCLYYFTQADRKKVLHRFHLSDQTDEELQLLPNFNGEYVALNDGTVFFKRASSSNLFVHRTDDTNEDLGKIKQTVCAKLYEESVPDFLSPEWYLPEIVVERETGVAFLATDGESLFVGTNRYFRDAFDYEVTLPEGKDDLIFYLDPETGQHLSNYDPETRKCLAYAWYGTPKENFLFTQYDSQGNKIRDLVVPIPVSNFDGYDGYRLNTLNPYFTDENVLLQCQIIAPDDPNAPGKDNDFAYIHVEERLEAFLSETAFPKPFYVTKTLWKKKNEPVYYFSGGAY